MRKPNNPGISILLTTDFSRPARRAYTYAVKLSLVFKARLILLHAVKAPPGSETWSPAARRSLEPRMMEARRELARMTRIAGDCGVVTELKVTVGIPEVSILEVAEERQGALIAMRTHGRTGWDRLQFGRKRRRCSHESTPDQLSRILVAMDFSASSKSVLRFGIMLAKRLKAKVRLVHACEPSGFLSSKRVLNLYSRNTSGDHSRTGNEFHG
ncbi:MAG: universal stress protein [Nitrospiraceae bacterium]